MRDKFKLTPLSVSSISEPGRYGDGGGLYLQVSKWQTKSWLFRYTKDGRSRHMGLGDVHTFTLKEARERARRQRQLLADGTDPIEARRAAQEAVRAEAESRVTFRAATLDFLAAHEATWRNPKHRQQWRNSLDAYAFPKLGDRPVAAIDDALINETLAGIWNDKPETASRVHQRIRRICKWIEDGRPLPKASKTRRTRHHPALPLSELPAFMADLRARDSISARALEFTVLTAARTGETIGTTWDEIDLDAKLWTVPAERTKSAREHLVPLSDRAVELLETLPREKGNPHVFPGAAVGRSLSNMAMLQLLRGMPGREGLTVHGFRSTFRDWAGERTNYPREVAEAALAHVLKDKTEAAYRRATALPKRTRMMRDWASFCASPAPAGNVIAMVGA